MLERDMNFEALELASLSDDQLLTETKRLVACERSATAVLLRSLMEVDCAGCISRGMSRC